MCCYREIKNFDRFVRLIQSIVLCTLQQLQAIQQEEQHGEGKSESASDDGSEKDKKEKEKDEEESTASAESPPVKLHWTHQDREKLFHLLSKIFLLNFPLYIAMKHGGAINPLAPVKVRYLYFFVSMTMHSALYNDYEFVSCFFTSIFRVRIRSTL